MGLDAHAYAIKDNEKIEIAYWRKHYSLNAFMHAINNGDLQDFDADDDIGVVGILDGVDLSIDDLEFLASMIPTFEYNDRYLYPNSWEKDLGFVSMAKERIKIGYRIEYSSV